VVAPDASADGDYQDQALDAVAHGLRQSQEIEQGKERKEAERAEDRTPDGAAPAETLSHDDNAGGNRQ